MYIPKHFEEKDIQETIKLIKEFGFATLVSTVGGKPWATHMPLELEIDEHNKWILFGHIARGNQQWENFENEPEVLAIFMGPNAYVSPSWYDHPNQPTWNYRAVHLSGKAQIIEGEKLRSKLRELMDRYETLHAQCPVKFDELPAKLLDTDIRALVGFEITVEKIESAAKMSQNRNEASYEGVVENLKKMDAYDSKRIAEEMEKRKNI